MSSGVIVEILGYTGMAVVIVSFLFSNAVILRFINTIGGILSAVYGFLTQTYPTAILNIILICINIYVLSVVFYKKIKLYRRSNNEPNRETDRREQN